MDMHQEGGVRRAHIWGKLCVVVPGNRADEGVVSNPCDVLRPAMLRRKKRNRKKHCFAISMFFVAC